MSDEKLLVRFQQAVRHFNYDVSETNLRVILDTLPATPHTLAGLKIRAERLADDLKYWSGQTVKHTKALELAARIHGYRNWHGAQQALPPTLPPYDPMKGWTVRPPLGHVRFVDKHAFIAPWELFEGIPEEMALEFTEYFNHRTAPTGWARLALEGHLEEAVALAGPRGSSVRRLMDLAGEYVTRQAFGSEEKVAAYLARPYGDFIPIGGINVGGVIATLYNIATPVRYGLAEFNSTPMSILEGSEIYEAHSNSQRGPLSHVYLDYVHHTRMKLLFQDTAWLNVRRFEEERLPGIAGYAVDVFREGGASDPRLLQLRHVVLCEVAKEADITLDTPDDDLTLTDTGRALLALLRKTAPTSPLN